MSMLPKASESIQESQASTAVAELEDFELKSADSSDKNELLAASCIGCS